MRTFSLHTGAKHSRHHGPRAFKVESVTRWFFFLSVLAAHLLLSALGCAPKHVVPPSALPATPRDAQVSAILLEQFRLWEGAPHCLGQAEPTGTDCSGFVQKIFWSAFGVKLPRTAHEQGMFGRSVEVGHIRPGDLLIFGEKGGDHVGIAANRHHFMHVSSRRGVIISPLEGYWRPLLRSVRRILYPESP